MIVRTTKTRAAFSRRALLRRLGASAAVLPLLDAGRARAVTGPKRLITVAMTNGVWRPAYYPADDADPTTGDILQPFAALRSKVLIPGGLDLKAMADAGRPFALGGGHAAYPSLFTGAVKDVDGNGKSTTATAPSIDHIVSTEIAKQVNLPVPLLNFAMAGRSTSYRGPDQRNTAETDTKRLFDALFASASAPPDQLAALRARRRSVLDFLKTDLQAFTARLGQEDRAKVEAHLASIRQLETALAPAAPRTCAAPAAPMAGAAFPQKIDTLVSLVAVAISCDLTRVVSLTFADDGGSAPNQLPWVDAGDYHATAHAGSSQSALKIKIDTWWFQKVADLATKLAATPEGGTSALDNSVIVVANDMQSGDNHQIWKTPFLMVGSCGGYFRTGRQVKLGAWVGKTGNYWETGFLSANGVPHNRLLAELCNAMDVPTMQIGAYAGGLPELR